MRNLKKDKKGFIFSVGAALFFLILIVGIVLLVSFLFSSELRWTLIGASIIGATVFLIGKGIVSTRGFDKSTTIIILIFAGVGLFFILGSNVLQQQYGAGSYLSIDSVNIVGEDVQIRAYVVARGSEDIQISFTKDELNQYLSGEGVSATKDVVGSIRFLEQQKKFRITKTSQPYYWSNYIVKGKTFSCTVADDCQDLGSGLIPIAAGKINVVAGLGNCVCIFVEPAGINGIFSGATDIDYKVQFTIGSQSVDLTDENREVVTLGTGSKIQWVGDLSNLQDLEKPSYNVLFLDGEWKYLIDLNAISFQNIEGKSLETCINSDKRSTFSSIFGPIYGLFSGKSENDIKNCVNTYNNRVGNSRGDKGGEWFDSVSDIVKSDGFEEDGFVVNLKVPVSFPTFIITLKATDVGIIPLKGKPDITACSKDLTFKSGDRKTTSFKVKNIGESSGLFIAKLSCDDGDRSESEAFFEKGEESAITISTSGTTTNPSGDKVKCKITVIDQQSGDSDICNFNKNIEYQSGIVCESNSIKCIDALHLRECYSDGLTFKDTFCEFGCSDNKCLKEGEENINPIPPELTPKEMCDQKAKDQPLLGWTWVESETTQGRGPLGIGGLIGLKKTIITGECKASFIIYYIIGGVILILLIIMINLLLKKKYRIRRRRR